MIYDIVTFGSASWDIYLDPKQMKIIPVKSFSSGKAIAFNLGSKIDLKKTCFSMGGGGVNSAFTFSRQGFKVAYCGCVGDDILGSDIIAKLQKQKIYTGLIEKSDKACTNSSAIFNIKGQDRTIMVYRGASEYLSKINSPKAKWYYLAPLSGKASLKTKEIISKGKKYGAKIAFNPGNSQLKMPIKDLLKDVDVLLLNQEEASILTKNDYKKEERIIDDLKKLFNGIIVMTKGKRGVVVINKGEVFREKSYNIKVVDKTGAGDAFGSGFISGLIKYKGDVKKAAKLGLKNSSSCIKKQGAINGLL